jgi:hypothetical protein
MRIAVAQQVATGMIAMGYRKRCNLRKLAAHRHLDHAAAMTDKV